MKTRKFILKKDISLRNITTELCRSKVFCQCKLTRLNYLEIEKKNIVLVCFVFLLLVYHLLPVSLPVCIFLIAPSVLSNVYLHPWRVLYEQNGMKLCFWVHFFFPSNFMFVICFALPPHRPVNARRVWRYQIRIRISKENTQHNVLKKKYKRTNNDLQNIHVKLRIEYNEPH